MCTNSVYSFFANWGTKEALRNFGPIPWLRHGPAFICSSEKQTLNQCLRFWRSAVPFIIAPGTRNAHSATTPLHKDLYEQLDYRKYEKLHEQIWEKIYEKMHEIACGIYTLSKNCIRTCKGNIYIYIRTCRIQCIRYI